MLWAAVGTGVGVGVSARVRTLAARCLLRLIIAADYCGCLLQLILQLILQLLIAAVYCGCRPPLPLSLAPPYPLSSPPAPHPSSLSLLLPPLRPVSPFSSCAIKDAEEIRSCFVRAFATASRR